MAQTRSLMIWWKVTFFFPTRIYFFTFIVSFAHDDNENVLCCARKPWWQWWWWKSILRLLFNFPFVDVTAALSSTRASSHLVKRAKYRECSRLIFVQCRYFHLSHLSWCIKNFSELWYRILYVFASNHHQCTDIFSLQKEHRYVKTYLSRLWNF